MHPHHLGDVGDALEQEPGQEPGREPLLSPPTACDDRLASYFLLTPTAHY